MRTVAAVLCLAAVWVIFTETISPANFFIGLVTAALAVLFSKKFLPAKKGGNFSYFKLLTYPFFLIRQIYVAGFHVIRVMFGDSKISVVTLKTGLRDEALRVALVDSITLTPGSILLNLEGDNVILLWFRGANEPEDLEYAELKLKSHIEKRLERAQK